MLSHSAVSTLFAVAAGEGMPTLQLPNGVSMPATGLGTGGYGFDPSVGYGGYPECWSAIDGCGDYTERAVLKYLELGGRRLDCATSYRNDDAVGRALAKSGVPREEVFIVDKPGPSATLGYADTLQQFEQMKRDFNTSYIDLLLVHWPYQNPSQGDDSGPPESSDPLCNLTATTFDGPACRVNTWKAMVEIYNAGGARAIGVSNYYIQDFEEIKAAGLPMPMANQNPVHIYRDSMEMREYMKENSVMLMSYSPFGVPDWHHFKNHPDALEHPVVKRIAERHHRLPSQVLLNWLFMQGIPSNPRSMNATHMMQNMHSFDFRLSEKEMKELLDIPDVMCDEDDWYECRNKTMPTPPPPPASAMLSSATVMV